MIVTHNPEVAAACDRTIRMRDGVVEDHGLEPEVELEFGSASAAPVRLVPAFAGA